MGEIGRRLLLTALLVGAMAALLFVRGNDATLVGLAAIGFMVLLAGIWLLGGRKREPDGPPPNLIAMSPADLQAFAERFVAAVEAIDDPTQRQRVAASARTLIAAAIARVDAGRETNRKAALCLPPIAVERVQGFTHPDRIAGTLGRALPAGPRARARTGRRLHPRPHQRFGGQARLRRRRECGRANGLSNARQTRHNGPHGARRAAQGGAPSSLGGNSCDW